MAFTNEQKKQWREKHKERLSIYRKQWGLFNKGKISLGAYEEFKRSIALPPQKRRKPKSVTHRKCHLCKVTKSLSAFYKEINRPCGRSAICRPCAEKRKFPKYIRKLALERFNNQCFVCNTKERLSLDHNKPLCLGGTHSLYNAVVLCLSHNSIKGKANPKDFYNQEQQSLLIGLGVHEW